MTASPATRTALFLAALALAVSGCDCRGGSGTKSSFGELGVIWRDAEGNRIVNRDALYDFGRGLVGQRIPLTMTARNTGAANLRLSALEVQGGDPVKVGVDPVAGSAFDVEFTPKDLEPSEQVEYQMYFTPQALKPAFESKLVLSTEGARTEDATALITLRGAGEQGNCEVPSTIDFGKVPVGETLSYTLEVRNPTTVDAQGFAGDVTGADAAAFGYAQGSARGSFPVAAGTTANVVFTFSPTEKRVYTALVELAGAGGCPRQTATIRGEGSDDVLTWTPTTLNFGLISPPFEGVRDVVFTNLSNVPITLRNVQTSMPTDFSHQVPAGSDATVFVVPGGGVPTPMHVVCAPAGLGPRQATLGFTTGLNRTPQGLIQLNCTGGGPKVKVTPRPNLAFGRVGFFPGSSSFNVTRKVTVQNVGTLPNPPDPASNLYLGQVDVGGTPGQLPFFEVNHKAGTAPSEITVTLASPYNPAVGLEAKAGANFVDFAVTVTPSSVGLKEADLVLYTNDSNEPAVTIKVTADAQQLPPCNYRVSPAMGNFGLVTPGTTKDLPITITNLGTAATDVCYLSGIDLSAGTSPAYTIVGGPVVEKELQPQESWAVVVRVAPPGPVPTTLQTLTGALTFNVTSPTNPQAVVPLRTSVGPSCLAITPDPLDFGVVKATTPPALPCSSPPRTFNIYNTCATAVTITGFAVQAAGGQAPGGPQCPGTSPCPEFFLVSTPSIPTGGLTVNPGAAPVTFQAKYAPIDLGADSGAIAINAVQSGQSLTYLVGLQGRGDAVGNQTDTFLQDLRPKADLLLVIDDSGSMSDEQASLANNFASFIQYAVAANVDYQIGVTTTTVEDCPPGFPCPPNPFGGTKDGKLRRDSAGLYILKPTTPNVAQKFAQFVNVGTSGSGTETGLDAATLALTPPLIANENLGFVRPAAALAVVVVSDAGDQSPQPVSYYQNRLLNVKGYSRLSDFTFNNIGPYYANPPSGCSYDGGGQVVRYESIVNFTGGVRDEICTNNWAATLQGLGRTAFGYRTQFFLGNVPDLSGGRTITVTIAGNPVTVASTCPAVVTAPCYDSASNSIKFTTTTTPGPGQTLEVTYSVACF